MSSASGSLWIEVEIDPVKWCRFCVVASQDDVCPQCGRVILPVFTTKAQMLAYVAEWLTNTLAEGPLLTSELQERAAREFPLHWMNIERAAEKLGFGFGTFFTLPYDHPYGRKTRDSQRLAVGLGKG